MRVFRRLALFLIFISSAVWAQDLEEPPKGRKYLIMYMGMLHQETLPYLPPGSEFFGDFRDIVKGEVDRENKVLRLKPIKAGLGTLTVHNRKGKELFKYRIEVRKSELTKVVREVRALLKDIEGITIKIVNSKVIIDGKVLLPSDLNRIYGVITQFGNKVASLVEISPLAQKKIAAIIERDINNPDIEVQAINGKFILKGIANSKAESDKAVIIAETYVPPPVINEAEKLGVIKKRKSNNIVINLLQIRAPPDPEPEKIIQLVVHYVEMSKGYMNKAAFKWSPGVNENIRVNLGSGQSSGGILSEITGVITGLLPKLNYARQYGHARVLESTSVTTKDGKKGVFNSTDQIPFLVRQPQNFGNTIQFATVGVQSQITPKVINHRDGTIELKMQFSVSNVTGQTQSGPQTSRNLVSTTVNVRSGQSAAVGGLIKNNSIAQYNGDPTDGAIFNLYSSKDFQNNKTQLVVFVTPIIQPSASVNSEKIKRKFRIRD